MVAVVRAPSDIGRSTSRIATCGSERSASETASKPSRASATTWISASLSRTARIASRKSACRSAKRTRMRSGGCVKKTPSLNVGVTSRRTLPTACSPGTHRKPYRSYAVRMRAVVPLAEPACGVGPDRDARRRAGAIISTGGCARGTRLVSVYRARGKGDEMVTDRHGRGLQARVHLELRQDALNVGPNGVATDAQPARDRASVGALDEQAEHLSLPRGELRDEQSDTVGRSTAMTCGNEAMGQDHLSTDDGFHRADEPSDRRVLREVAAEPRLEGLIDGPRVIERGNGHQLRLRPPL